MCSMVFFNQRSTILGIDYHPVELFIKRLKIGGPRGKVKDYQLD